MGAGPSYRSARRHRKERNRARRRRVLEKAYERLALAPSVRTKFDAARAGTTLHVSCLSCPVLASSEAAHRSLVLEGTSKIGFATVVAAARRARGQAMPPPERTLVTYQLQNERPIGRSEPLIAASGEGRPQMKFDAVTLGILPRR